jgi:hypothetical protein
MDLVEAAVRTGRHAEAAAHVTAIRDGGIAALSPRLALLVTAAEAIAAPDDIARGLFERALAVPGADRFPSAQSLTVAPFTNPPVLDGLEQAL